MNFIEIFRKYDKVVESFVRKTKSKSTRDIIDVADKYVTKDKEILRQLKEFIKQDGHEEYFGFKEDLPGCFYIEHQNNEGEFEEWVITELNLITSMEDGNMDDNLGEEGSYVEVVAVPEDYSNYATIRWEELDVETRNQILDYLNFTDLRYDRINESFTKKIKKQTSKNVIDNADEDIKMNSPLTFEDDEVSNIFFNEVVDVEDYEGGVYTLEDASVDSHVHDGYSEYFPFDDYQSNSWRDKNIVRFHELRFFTGLKKLPEYAFVNCTSLKELTLPDNLEEIEQGAFANCTSLKTVKMPKNRTLRFINDSAFANTGLVSVVIPDGVEEIGDCAFADCHYLESVVIPPSVKEIRRGAFSGCPKLKSVSGIESVQDVGTDVFYGCGIEKEFSDSSVFSKFVTLRKFDEILFSGDWIDDSRKVKEMFLETYCMNHYDTDDYKHITDEEWEKDEFNPDSSNFDKERFYEYAWDYACDDVSWEWDDFKQSIEEKFQGRGGWICPEDEERFYNFSEAFSYCIPNDCNWQDLKVEQDGGYLIVCGTVIVPECDRYIDDEIGEIYPNEFIDYNSLRFCDPILDKETF